MGTFDYQAMRAAEEARKTLPARLRDTPTTGEPSRLMAEAADALEHKDRVIAQLRQEAREAERDARDEIRGAVAEARWQGQQGDEYGSY